MRESLYLYADVSAMSLLAIPSQELKEIEILEMFFF